MFHRAIDLCFKQNTSLEVTFRTGEVKLYDMSVLFPKYPQLKALSDRNLFLKGQLFGYGIVWNDELDIETETIYEDGITVREEKISGRFIAADALLQARANVGISQSELSSLSGIDQSDISKIERGVANPSVETLSRLAEALDMNLKIIIE